MLYFTQKNVFFCTVTNYCRLQRDGEKNVVVPIKMRGKGKS